MAMDAAGELLAALYQLVESKAGSQVSNPEVPIQEQESRVARPRAKQLPRSLLTA
jgi:hypothetical protein